jgi:hypothetical protein
MGLIQQKKSPLETTKKEQKNDFSSTVEGQRMFFICSDKTTTYLHT